MRNRSNSGSRSVWRSTASTFNQREAAHPLMARVPDQAVGRQHDSTWLKGKLACTRAVFACS